MKTALLIVCVSTLSLNISAQQPLFVNQPKDSVVRLDPQLQQFDFVPGEILVKYKDEVQVANLKVSGIVQTGLASIDTVFARHRVSNADRLFPKEQRLKSKIMLRSFSGQEFEQPSLHNIYKLTLPNQSNMFMAIEELKKDSNIVYAEPNYILSITNVKPVSPVLSEKDLVSAPFSNVNHYEAEPGEANLSLVTRHLSFPAFPSSAPANSPHPKSPPNDPLYSQQWYIPAVHADEVWDSIQGKDSTQVICILDTGVDWLHPDLQNKIWSNPGEIPGNGIDDDGNGYVDDVRGWDFINNDNNPQDDNSHGTHCAGIAAAQANNNIGICGVSWGARIMPIKVFQSSGNGNASTIAQGVTYAANNGATVLSMSFGSYAESITLKSALANAYATAVLVAAGGNDGLCIGPGSCPDLREGFPLYPGAYSFVFGVVATKQESDFICGVRACFSNFDDDGPVFSAYYDLLNYELQAPGAEILSCIPGGNYRVYSGTSMATPLVAGAISLYATLRPEESTEMLFGNLINSMGDHLDLKGALNIVPIPMLNMVTCEIADTLDGDGDGRADAGETIEFKVLVRNTWGQTDSVKVGIAFHEFEDTTTATILTRESMVGSISAYATLFNTIPLKVQFANGLSDGRDIVFDLTTWYDDHQGEETRQIVISVENGKELGGIISSDLILYPAQQYIITEHLAIPQGVTLTIKPGTTLKFGEGKSMIVAGKVKALGTKDSLITFTKRNLGGDWKGVEVWTSASSFHAAYTIFEHAGNGNFMFYCPGDDLIFNNCCFIENIGAGFLFSGNAIIEQSCFYNNKFSYVGLSSNSDEISLNNIVQNTSVAGLETGGAFSTLTHYFFPKKNNIFSNLNIVNNKEINIAEAASNFGIIILDSMYYGTLNEEKINNGIYDFP